MSSKVRVSPENPSPEEVFVKNGIFEHHITRKEIADTINENQFLCDAILAIMAPDLVRESDLPGEPEWYKEQLLRYFIEDTNYSNEFVESVFNHHKF